MADPLTLGTIGLGTTAAGGITGAIGSLMGGDASAGMYQYKAGMALMNQQINKQNAAFALESGDINAEESGLKAGQGIAGTKVAQAAGGVDVNTGTPAEVRTSQQATAKFDQDVIRFDASKTAYGYEAKAASAAAEAQLDTMAAKNAKSAGILGAVTSILGGASSVASKWSQGSQIGIFS